MSAVSAPHGRVVLTADEAAAHAVTLARVQAIGCYPITPQTVIVERLAELVAGRTDVEFANLESEHAMFAWTIAASRVGVRTFTATSSQGLLYAHEQLHRASRERIPLVAVDVNRAVFAPWSIQPDLSDSMSQRDTGWVQLYCASAQEVLDALLCAYRVAERAMLPVLVCLEGFLLSHTTEAVDVPTQEEVDAFLPPLRPPDDWLLDPNRARAFSELPEPLDYAAFQRHVDEAMAVAAAEIEAVAAEFEARFGRPHAGALSLAGDPTADTALVTIGSIGETALELLEDDRPVRLVRVHAFRPFPAAALTRALAGARTIAVVDRAPGFGSMGPLGGEVRALRLDGAVTTFIGGLGGTEVTPTTLRWVLERAAKTDPTEAALGPISIPEGVER